NCISSAQSARARRLSLAFAIALMAPRSRRVLPLCRQRTPWCAGMVAKIGAGPPGWGHPGYWMAMDGRGRKFCNKYGQKRLPSSTHVRYKPDLDCRTSCRIEVRERLTARQVQHAKPGRYGDGGGLWLQVSASGSRSWLLRYQRHGKAHWMGLGSAKLVTL